MKCVGMSIYSPLMLMFNAIYTYILAVLPTVQMSYRYHELFIEQHTIRIELGKDSHVVECSIDSKAEWLLNLY